MTQYSRRVGALRTNALPAYTSTTTDANKLYAFGQVTSVLDNMLVWPGGGGAIPNMNGGGDGSPAQQHRGWGSCWYVPDFGTHGAMVFGRTGEFTMENQRTYIDMATGNWGIWDQPFCCLTEASAATADADYYYNLADYNAIKNSRGSAGIVYGSAAPYNYTNWGDTEWDGTFPVGLPLSTQEGWVQRRKLTGNNFGNGVVARYRYNNHATIPASWTGLGCAALLINPRVLGGPFQGSVQLPLGLTDASRWHAQMTAGGQTKHFLSYQRLDTKAKALITTAHLPDSFSGYTGDTHCWLDSRNKRAYFMFRIGALAAWYADFSNGIAGMTISTPVAFTRINDYDMIPSDSANHGSTDGHRDGRRLIYFMSHNSTASHLVLLDMDGNTLRLLTPIPGLTWQSAPGTDINLGFNYDPASNVMRIAEQTQTGEVYVHSFEIPADPLVASNYSVSRVQLSKAPGAAVDTTQWIRMFGERPLIQGYIGGRVVIPQYANKPLTFKPS